MVATIQLFLALGLGRAAVVADVLLTVTVLAVVAVLVMRDRSRPAVPPTDVVAEAEAVVLEAGDRQPA